MNTQKLNGKDLLTLGFTEGKIIGLILNSIHTHYKQASKDTQLTILKGVLTHPENYTAHQNLSAIANELLKPAHKDETIALKEKADDYSIYGAEGIEQGALDQIETAMRLPITKAGALMADAHQGYGLPIGGVLATENAVIPYGVGVDIGCRMCLSMYHLSENFLEEKREDLKTILIDNTRFGRTSFKKPIDHEVLENSLFHEIQLIKNLKDKAFSQIGTSGGGNHFVEFGIVEILDEQNEFGLAIGKYMALLSHSGSRGFGAQIARHYTNLAMDRCKLPQKAKHLAWLDLDKEAGQEYWLAMNLAGDYASACHHQIHERIAHALAQKPAAMVENHHNFAWKEKDAQGNEIIVHRKGATPAGKGVLGIIPGSMASPGFIVRGKGAIASINSASHGAGRVMSRKKAKANLDAKTVSDYLAKAGVTLIGSDLDEAPMAYKNIHQVMAAQQDLVDIVGSFMPKIVRMCGDKDGF